jgi:hypothetical protein
MSLSDKFFGILKDSVKLTDSVERLNSTVEDLKSDVHDIDKRMVRLETMVEMAQNQKRID